MTDSVDVRRVEEEFRQLFAELHKLEAAIRTKIQPYADGKTLKGNELVAWLGEVYGKLLLNGTLVDDSEEHDFITMDGRRVSVKARKGYNPGWQRTSAIPKIEGHDCPTHLMFVHLNDDYSIDRIWLFPWEVILSKDRFKKHTVRGSHRSFIFNVDETRDKAYVVLTGDA